MSLSKESQKLKLIDFGWAMFPRKISMTYQVSKRKHYFLKDSNLSICGVEISNLELKEIVFIDKTTLPINRICVRCENAICGCDCHHQGCVPARKKCTSCLQNHTQKKYLD